MSWTSIAAHISSSAPELAEALSDKLDPSALQVLAIDGRPGETCWGSGSVRPAIFCPLTDADVEALLGALHLHGLVAHLRSLEIRAHAGVGDAAAAAIAKLLDDRECVLESLDLTGCEVTGAGAGLLCAPLNTEHHSLRALHLGYNPLGREGGLALAEMLQRNRSLETLSLANTSIDTQAAVMLYSVLRDQPVVLEVDLQKAVLFSRQEETAKHAAQMLSINRTMQVLNLANLRVGDMGAESIAKSLTRNSTLMRLNLANNSIGVAGGAALGDLLAFPACALRGLDLGFNKIGDKGAAAIGKALAANTCLKSLSLESNQICDSGLLEVAKGMAINSTLRKLKLWGNNFPQDPPRPRGGAQGEEEELGEKPPLEGEGAQGAASLYALSTLLRGKFVHLDVEVDIQAYTVDGLTQIARVVI